MLKGSNVVTHAFELKGLVKRYPGFQLGPLDLVLEPGYVLGYIGPNGSGKTTTMHCMSGLVRPDAGESLVFGRKVEPTRSDWKYSVGYVGDQHVFYERWTAQKNLDFLSKFYPAWSAERAASLARRFELPLEKRAKDLSTGNRVKLSLIGVLARSPRLLLLDEPTMGLDPVVRSEVLETLFEVLEDGESSIFYSTHILSDISRLADELAFLSDGKLLSRAPKEELSEKWRRISCRLRGGDFKGTPVAAASISRNGSDCLLVSSDYEETVAFLRESGASEIIVTRMAIDEIAVAILKGGNHVAAT